MHAGSCWAVTTTDGAIIGASRMMAGLLRVSVNHLRACNLFSLLDAVPRVPTTNSGRHAASAVPCGRVTINGRDGLSIPMQVAVFDHQENKLLWLFSAARDGPDRDFMPLITPCSPSKSLDRRFTSAEER